MTGRRWSAARGFLKPVLDRPNLRLEINCLVDKIENCFPMIPSGKAHNDMLLADLSDDAGLEIGSIIDEKGKMLV